MGARGRVPAEEELTLSLAINNHKEVPTHFTVIKLGINTKKLQKICGYHWFPLQIMPGVA